MFCQEFERSFAEEAEDGGGVVFREADDYVEDEEEEVLEGDLVGYRNRNSRRKKESWEKLT